MAFKWDGKTRVSNDTYRENFDRIFKTNPMAKEVRTPKYKQKKQKKSQKQKKHQWKSRCLKYI